MNKQKVRCVLISDFNLDIFSGYLSNDEELPAVAAVAAPFGQVTQLLVQEDPEYWNGNTDFAFIWTRPEGVIKSFNDLLAYNPHSIADILDEVDQFASLLLKLCDRVRFVFVPAWIKSFNRGSGLLDMKKDVGIANILMQMNLRLCEIFEQRSNIYLLDSQNWVNAAGKYAFNPRLWYRGKIAFGNDVYKAAVRDIKSAIRGLEGLSKKVLVLDLDNTLWGGVVGDLGWEGIVLGGHDPIGEAFADFQRALKALSNRGVLLAIVSKNEEPVALEAINKHPEMVLRLKDFAGWRINWLDKASNIADLIADLNLGLQSVVFIDDNPMERARVRETLSEVLVPEWPEDIMLYTSTLLGLRCFDSPSLSKEDTERTKMYISEKQRKELRKSLGSFDEWLGSLETRTSVEELNRVNLQRTAQLLNKTSQMNLSTRRLSERELADWADEDYRKLWTFRVSDKLGDSGLTGIISLEVINKTGRIVDFVLSCRVIGRKVEEAMLFTVIDYARGLGLDELVAEFLPTQKNKPCLDFWKRSGFDFDVRRNSFTWDVERDFQMPEHIEILTTEHVDE
ncbi:MAG: HAD-IIIC family phosphatase [Nitrospirae bacterium]|nr:HAD-IIIC family phosphatase [Nitrospirota bacterium]